jgi:hypothetical protein
MSAFQHKGTSVDGMACVHEHREDTETAFHRVPAALLGRVSVFRLPLSAPSPCLLVSYSPFLGRDSLISSLPAERETETERERERERERGRERQRQERKWEDRLGFRGNTVVPKM